MSVGLWSMLALCACTVPDSQPPDTSDTGPEEQSLPTAGQDIDEVVERELASSYALPDEFYAALDTLGLTPDDLGYPDAGATWYQIPTRLKWTDTLRHQGDTAPVFAHMVGEAVESALAAEDGLQARELLVAAHLFNGRSRFDEVRFDERFEVLDPEEPLVAAIAAWYARSVEGDPELPEKTWEEREGKVRTFAGKLPLDTRAHLALAIQGLTRAAELRDEALFAGSDLSMDQWDDLHWQLYGGRTGYSTYTHEYGTDAAPGVDFDQLARAGQLALRSTESLRLAMAQADVGEGARLNLLGPLGRLVLALDHEADTWEYDDVFLLVELGGDDEYKGHVAVNAELWQPVSVVLDLEGADTWRHREEWDISLARIDNRSTRMQGAGLFGIAIVDDAAGDDDYHSAGVAQGVGVFGVGVLIDHQGSDHYRAYDLSQGAADFGYGLLLDLGEGHDRHETLQKSQGYGGPRGMGFAVDEAGDDTWLAIAEPLVYDWAGEGSNWSGSQGFGYGVRDGFFYEGAPIFSGGLGGLFDLAGDDHFQCAVMCQGFGYAFGTGLFYDPQGNDDHLVTHKYAFGSATHWAVGLLVDGDGDDTYRNSDDDECMGLGYDASVAFLLDQGQGADTYTLDNVSDFTLGAGRIPALGTLIDEGGDDAYHLPGSGSRALGRSYTQSGNRDGYLGASPNIGLFFDLGGTDTYDTAREDVGNGVEWVQTAETAQGGDWVEEYDFGYGLDL